MGLHLLPKTVEAKGWLLILLYLLGLRVVIILANGTTIRLRVKMLVLLSEQQGLLLLGLACLGAVWL